MKLSLNVDFDSLEEYLEFFTMLQSHFGSKEIGPNYKATIAKNASSSPATAKQMPPSASVQPKDPVAKLQSAQLKIKPTGFQPPADILNKVNEYITKGQAFKTQDVAPESVMQNSRRRTRINQWLKAHPNLKSERPARSKGGPGPLVYRPIRAEMEDDATIRPKAEKQMSQANDLKKQQPKSARTLSFLGFHPTAEMQRKVREYIKMGQSFKTQDIVGTAIIESPNRRAGANRWLQSHAELRFEYSKAEKGKGGRGPLIYSPTNKITLPPASKPSKSDWPIKGATYKPVFTPATDFPEEEDLYGTPS